MARRTKWTAKKKSRFFELIADGYSVRHACRQLEAPRSELYRLRETDEKFAQRWQDAWEEGTELLEDEAYRRAARGVEEPVFHQGEQVATVRKYSDTMLIFLLKGRKPDVYKDRIHQEHTGPDGKAIPITTILVEKPSGADDGDA